MGQVTAGSTNPELLRRVAALRDNPAWPEFFGLYDPLVRDWCSVYGFDAASLDELCQRVWVELARRMPAYRYDPGCSFRHWLRRLCHHRAIDLWREQRDRPFQALTSDDLIDKRWTESDSDDSEFGADKLLLLKEAQEVQEAVKRKVKQESWDVFWRVAIEGQPTGEVAAAMGLKYTTAYHGFIHVRELLRAEGRRRRGRLGLDSSPNPAKP